MKHKEEWLETHKQKNTPSTTSTLQILQALKRENLYLLGEMHTDPDSTLEKLPQKTGVIFILAGSARTNEGSSPFDNFRLGGGAHMQKIVRYLQDFRFQ